MAHALDAGPTLVTNEPNKIVAASDTHQLLQRKCNGAAVGFNRVGKGLLVVVVVAVMAV